MSIITNRAVIFYDFYKKNAENQSIINPLYANIFPYTKDKASDYTAFMQYITPLKSEWDTTGENTKVSDEKTKINNLRRHYDIRKGSIVLPNGEKNSYKGITSTLDFEIQKYRRIKTALDNIEYDKMRGIQPTLKQNVSISNVLKESTDLPTYINDNSIITVEKFDKSLISKDSRGLLPDTAEKSVYFILG